MPSPEIEFITIKGFKSFASIERLPLRAINLVIGPNGSGKSNFIEVFAFLNAICEERLEDYVARAGGAEKLLHFGSKTTNFITIHISFQNADEYGFSLIPRSGDQLHRAAETSSGIARTSDPNSPLIPGILQRHLNSWRHYHFHDTSAGSPMKKTASLNDNRFLRPDGSNLAAFLYLLREKYNAAYALIRSAVQRVAPFFDDFQLQPLQLKPDTLLLEWRHKGTDAYFDASMFSDGTLRFIALATLFLQPQEYLPSVILIDEPELGLHPYAITMLASLIKQASAHTQVIIGTQSPLLLDHFRPEDVIVADRVGGATQLTRLESGKLSQWLEDYSLGQLWEKNEIGGRPAKE